MYYTGKKTLIAPGVHFIRRFIIEDKFKQHKEEMSDLCKHNATSSSVFCLFFCQQHSHN